MEFLTTGGLAKEAGVNIDTVRYYEKRGLLPKPPRRASGYRMFRNDAVRRIVFIKHAQEIGFSLHEIEELLFLRVSSKTSCREMKKRTEAKIAEVEGKILNLQRIKLALEKMAAICRANKRVNGCPILDMLDEEGREFSPHEDSDGTPSSGRKRGDKRILEERCPSCGAAIPSEGTTRPAHTDDPKKNASVKKGG